MPLPLLIAIITVSAIIFLILAASLICFFKIFYSWRKKTKEEYPIPPGKEYEPYREAMIEWIKAMRSMQHKKIELISHDGLKLSGKYFELKEGAPIEILFHGYKGTAERDLSGGIERCFTIGHNALIVDHRASGESEGRVITFGAKESLDLLLWVDYVINNIDKNAKIILTGISMGAATVMISAGYPLPKNVIGVLADCGYTSTREIIKKVIRDMHLPANLLYPLARLGAILFGRFDPDKKSPIASMQRSSLPIIFFHGDSDGFVPAEMSRENYDACTSEAKKLIFIEGAAHGLAFPRNKELYCRELSAFFAPFEK